MQKPVVKSPAGLRNVCGSKTAPRNVLAGRAQPGRKIRQGRDFHDFLFFGRALFVGISHKLVRQLLHVFRSLLLFVFADGLVFFQLFKAVVGIAAHVAHRHLGFFGIFAGHLDQILAALFGQRRYHDAYDLAVIDGRKAQVRLQNGLFNHRNAALVPWLDGHGAAVGHGNGGHLADGRGGAVIVALDAVHQGGGGAARAQLGKIAILCANGFFHAVFGVQKDAVYIHQYSPWGAQF